MTATEWNFGTRQRSGHSAQGRESTDSDLDDKTTAGRGLAGRLGDRIFELLRRRPAPASRLALLERIGLAPRQSLVLVEADGHKFLIGLSAEAAPTFFALDTGRDLGEVSSTSHVRLEGTVS